jgi:hypothetical protein
MSLQTKKPSNGKCKHAVGCDLRTAIDALALKFSDRFGELLQTMAEDRERFAGSLSEVRTRLGPLEQREEQAMKLLQDATRALGENKSVMAAAMLMIKEVRNA